MAGELTAEVAWLFITRINSDAYASHPPSPQAWVITGKRGHNMFSKQTEQIGFKSDFTLNMSL